MKIIAFQPITFKIKGVKLLFLQSMFSCACDVDQMQRQSRPWRGRCDYSGQCEHVTHLASTSSCNHAFETLQHECSPAPSNAQAPVFFVRSFSSRCPIFSNFLHLPKLCADVRPAESAMSRMGRCPAESLRRCRCRCQLRVDRSGCLNFSLFRSRLIFSMLRSRLIFSMLRSRLNFSMLRPRCLKPMVLQRGQVQAIVLEPDIAMFDDKRRVS